MTASVAPRLSWLPILLRSLLAFVFLVAGAVKIYSIDQARDTIATAHLVPPGSEQAVAVILIALELAAGIGLLIPNHYRASLYLALGLSSLFTSFSVWKWYRDIPIPCSCFGPLFKLTPIQSLAFDLVLLALVGVLLSDPASFGKAFSARYSLSKEQGALRSPLT
jgi:uncharacterized membrane protein YphA (DoxX/SURF4 family)